MTHVHATTNSDTGTTDTHKTKDTYSSNTNSLLVNGHICSILLSTVTLHDAAQSKSFHQKRNSIDLNHYPKPTLHSAPEALGIFSAMTLRSMPRRRFIFREWMPMMSMRDVRVGCGNSILRSIRPGRSSAGSRMSIRFVAITTCKGHGVPRRKSSGTKYIFYRYRGRS